MPKITDAYDELAPLAKHRVLALQLGQMLGDSGPRRTHQAGEVFMAESDSQQRAPRFFDAKVLTEFEQRHLDALVKVEVQKSGAAQEQPIPKPQITLVELSECGWRSTYRNSVETVPAYGAEPAITIGLALKAPSTG